MSEAQNPVAEAPVAAATNETPVVAEASAVSAEAPAESPEPAAAEQPTKEAKDVTPATDGVLGHKGPGLVKGLRFVKRYFYFSEEPVDSKNLTAFHQTEKTASANSTAVWATQTGKGLLFMTKRAEDRATPLGIFNLAEMSDLAKEGSNEFTFKIHGQKHTFQAGNTGDRDGWFIALEAKAAEATAEKEAITTSEAYKAELERLTKPAGVEPATKKPEVKKDEAAPAEAGRDAKSRSRSRKRASLFSSLRVKKEEAEEKKEDKGDDAKAAEASPETSIEAADATAAEAPVEVETTGDKEAKKAETPAGHKSKRTSLFGNFFQKVTSPTHEKSEKEANSATETAASSAAPQLDNPVEESSNVTATAEPEAAKDEAAKDTADAPAEATPAEAVATPTKDKRRTSFFGSLGVKKEKKADTSDSEGTDKETKTKTNKFGGLFRKSGKAPSAEERKDAAPTQSETKPEQPEIAKKDMEPVAEADVKTNGSTVTESPEHVNVAPIATPVQAAA